MPPLFKPGPGTLLALERELCVRLERHSRRVLGHAGCTLFNDDAATGEISLHDLAGRIVELHTSLGVEETKAYRAAKTYLMAFLLSKHGIVGAVQDSAEAPENKRVAEELLAVLGGTDA